MRQHNVLNLIEDNEFHYYWKKEGKFLEKVEWAHSRFRVDQSDFGF